MSALTLQSIRKTFGSAVALDELNLEVREGELLSLVGPSGCGKTTVLRVAAGLDRADSGSVLINGCDISSVPARQRAIGMVLQTYSLFPNLTVARNVDFGLRTRKMAKAARILRVSEMLELVELEDLAQRYPHQLSGGEQQRVALARALAIQPEVLLLDDPLGALDTTVRLSLRDEIRRIQTTVGITTLLVTRDPQDALSISDRAGVMSAGRLDQLATPAEIYRNPVNASVARLVGPMNELPASVLDSGAVEIMGSVLKTPAASNYAAGSEVTVQVRPENAGLSIELADGLVGTIVSLVFQGAATVVRVRLDVLDELVNVQLESAQAGNFCPGQRVSVSFDGSHAICEARTA